MKGAGWVLGAVALLGAVGAVFGPVLGFPFLNWDDLASIVFNPLLHEPWTASSWLELLDPTAVQRVRAVPVLVQRAVVEIGGLEPAWFHGTALVFHGLVALGLWWVLTRLATLAGLAPRPAQVAAWWAAAVWALHPERAEPVAWATAMTYPVAGAFTVAAVAAWIRAWERRDAKGWAATPRALALACTFLASMTYPVALTVPGVLLALDVGVFRGAEKAGELNGAPRWRAALGRFLLLLLPCLAVAVVSVAAAHGGGGPWPPGPGLGEMGLGSRAVLGGWNAWHILRRGLLPMDLTPEVIWVPRALLDSLEGALAALALLLAGGGAVWALAQGRMRLLASALLAWASLALPGLNLTQVAALPADRYTYLSGMVWPAALAFVVAALARRGGRWGLGLGGALAVGLLVAAGWTARRQAMIWSSAEALFPHVLETAGKQGDLSRIGYLYSLWALDDQFHGRVAMAETRRRWIQGLFADAASAALAGNDALAFARAVDDLESLGSPRGDLWLAWTRAQLELGNERLAAEGLIEAARRLGWDHPDVEMARQRLRPNPPSGAGRDRPGGAGT